MRNMMGTPRLLAAAILAAPMVQAAESGAYALEEVVVTAQKKAESLQDAPISLTAFGQQELETKGINSLSDIGANVPSMSIQPFPINNATLRIFIRGIGISDAQITQDPPVGVYMDGVYIARSTGTALDVADLERIEILRGPQGTLYGRNTTGGAVNLVTRKPSTEALEFEQKFTVGDRSLFTSKTSANIPVTDTLAAKLAFMTTQQDGFIENTGPGGDYGDREVQGYRLDVRWDVNETMTLDYAYDRSELDYYNTSYQAVTRPLGDKGQAEPIKEHASEQTVYSSRRLDKMATGKPLEESNTEITGHALTFTAGFDGGEFKYIAAYRELSDASYADIGGGAGSTEFRLDTHRYKGQATNDEWTPLVKPLVTQRQRSHELQVSGDAWDSRLEYLVGAYYFKERAIEDNSPLHHQLSADARIPGVPFRVHVVNLLSQHYEIENEAMAFFGQATWTPNVLEDRLQLTFGARHSRDKRSAIKNQTDLNIAELYGLALDLPWGTIDQSDPGRQFDDVQASKKFDDNSFSFVAEYDLTDSINLYGKVNEAYKSGGFNTRDPQRDGNQGPASDGIDYGFGFVDGFDEEKVRSMELGIKSELMDRRLRINADIFKSVYSDMQLNFLLAGTVADTKITNAGEAEMQGLEADITFMATRNLLLMLNYAYLDAEVTKARDVNGQDVSDQFVFFAAPEQSYTAVADWTIVDADWGRLGLNVSYNYMDERNGGSLASNVKNTRLEAYGVWNARLGLNEMPLAGGMLSVAAWGKNLLDEEYAISAIDNQPQADRSVLWGDPRSYGVDLIYRY
ncbi:MULTISPECIES: TonB-dependent receptor [Spongiibacter]|uniref:TonB-dependent receptor n=1 Tax=Spongiibacter TaxID=630749 RepID=UPI000C3B5B47|nr:MULTISPECIES: TonB-dependent receptor [Spongiibacter]MAY37957.1 TonB-dependent receptor [Spongiibacter sp.]MBI58536.1 TonB-dependent receptor [Spongiibacter sp.]|tara:strand:+ start:2023 stop:4419 length:2397 start_codon:yes stop_codon:yes gene_type:complete